MKIHCRKCRTSYTVPDDWVPAHLSRATCRACGTPFVFFVTSLPEPPEGDGQVTNKKKQHKPAARR